MGDLRVTRTVTIPARELDLSFSTSGGPGGQHANKAATRVEVSWNVDASRALGPRQRHRVRTRLARRIDASGTLRLSSDRHRSQMRNREDVLQRLSVLVRDALSPEKQRVGTVPTGQSREKRLAQKKRRAEIKRLSGAVVDYGS